MSEKRFDPDALTIKVKFLGKEIPRQSLQLKPFGDYHDLIWEHCVDPKSANGHAITIARDVEGLQIFLCCVGVFLVKRSDVSDPYLLETEDGPFMLTGLCENFQRIKDCSPSPTASPQDHNRA
jgi:hypothetical protein